MTIVLVEGRSIPPDPENNATEPYVKFRWVENFILFISCVDY